MKNIILALFLVFSLNAPALAAHVTVSEEDARIVYSVGGTPDDTFDIPFTFYDEDDIRVFVEGTELPADDFTVTGAPGTTGGYEGGELVLDDTVTSSTVIILLDIPLSRTTDFPVSGSFNITSLNTQLDKLVSMQQVMDAKYKRALKLPETSELLDDDSANIDLAFLEDPTDGSIFYYSAGGGGFVNGADGSTLEADLATLDADLASAAAAASNASASATAAAASAATLYGTSASSVLIGTGSKAFTTQSGKQFSVGTWLLLASDADESNYMHGQVTAYTGTSLTVNVTNTGGTGTFADWVISVAGTRGATGAQGPQGQAGAGTGDMLGANNLSDLANAGTSRTNLGLGTIATQNSNGVTITGGAITGVTDIAIADGGTGASTAADAFTALKQAASESATGVVELATTAECTTGTDTARACTPAGVAAAVSASSTITLGTAQNTTSGTSINFTSIPAGTKRITVNFKGVSTNGTADYLIQIGDAGGLETTGYLGWGALNATSSASVNYTTCFCVQNDNASAVWHGSVVLTLLDSAANTWVASGVLGRSDLAAGGMLGGSKSLSATLDRISLVSTDTFDAGSINITYE